jgi:hypothetical protein
MSKTLGKDPDVHHIPQRESRAGKVGEANPMTSTFVLA